MENRPSSRHPSFAFFIILTEVADPNSTPTFKSPVTVPVARGCRFLHPTFHSCRRNSSVSVFVVKVQSITNFEQEEDGRKWSDPIALNSCTNGYSRVPGSTHYSEPGCGALVKRITLFQAVAISASCHHSSASSCTLVVPLISHIPVLPQNTRQSRSTGYGEEEFGVYHIKWRHLCVLRPLE